MAQIEAARTDPDRVAGSWRTSAEGPV